MGNLHDLDFSVTSTINKPVRSRVLKSFAIWWCSIAMLQTRREGAHAGQNKRSFDAILINWWLLFQLYDEMSVSDFSNRTTDDILSLKAFK